MKKLLAFYFLLVFTFISVAQDISGDWNGTLDIQGTKLGVEFNISLSENQYKTLLSVPKQGLNKVEVSQTTFINSILTISHPELKLEYKGSLSGDNFIGNIVLGGTPFAMTLKKGRAVLNRPQEPKIPLSYYTEDVTFKNESEDFNLKGTLSLPKKEGAFPVVIIISGSGPQNRDGEIFGHKPYLVIADHLAKNGVGVLRFDERGVGASEGDFETATIEDFASDINSAIAYLKTRKDVNKSKIGLIGHSIGGIVAPKVASDNDDVSYLVLLAAPGIPGDQLMLLQKAALERIMGFSEMQISQGQELMKGAYNIIKNSGLYNEKLKDSLHSFYIKKYGVLLPDYQRKNLVNQITNNEVASLLKSEPQGYLAKVKCPVLAVNGSKDFQVVPKENLNAIQEALEVNGNKEVQIIEFQGLNHLFQECDTGAINEYSEIEQTISPVVLESIINWIKEQIE